MHLLDQNFRKPVLLIKLAYLLGILSWGLSLIGFYLFFQLNTLYWFFAIPIWILTVYYLVNYSTNLLYKETKGEDLTKKIVSIRENTTEWPEIDIFLPVCGEDKVVLENTWNHVKQLKYEGKFNIFVGDDKGEKEVEKMAKRYKFNYLSRPNKGEMKKTGNLKYLLEHSKAPFYVVFDADFCPHKNFLQITIALIKENKKIGILQTPQAFRTGENAIEQAASETQYDFYKIIQTSRNELGGAICVGSNAVFRRSAIEECKVFEWLTENNIDHGEDVNTGFKLVDNGYKIKYLPVDLAFGESPQTIESFIKQRNRWCSSSTRMFLSNIVLKSNLTIPQKICYYTGFLYYLTDPIKFLLNYMLFVVLINHGNTLRIENSFLFLPHIIFGMFLLPSIRNIKKTKEARALDLILSYTNTLTVWNRVLGRTANWVPTGKVSKKDETVTSVKTLARFNFLLYIIFFVFFSLLGWVPFNNIQAYTVLFWVFYFIYNHFVMFKFLK